MVSTSQSRIDWIDSTIRAKSDHLIIKSLVRKDVEKIATAWGLNSTLAYKYSFGYPQVLVWLRENPSLNEQEIARRAKIFFLEIFSEQSKELALFASLFPGFDTAILKEMLPPNSNLKKLSKREMQEILIELVDKGLIVYGDQDDYYFYRYCEGAVRRLLSKFFREQSRMYFKKPSRELLNTSSKTQYMDIFEWLFNNIIYHLALAAKTKKGAGYKMSKLDKTNHVVNGQV